MTGACFVYTSTYSFSSFDPKVFFKDYYSFEEITKNEYEKEETAFFSIKPPVDKEKLKTDINNSKIIDGVTYKRIIYTICERKTKSERYFIVFEEQITKEELVRLSPYCRCRICTSYINFGLACPCCYGCMKTGVSSKIEVVQRTREYYNRRNNKRWWQWA